jgi:hypothetical protein
MALSPWWAEMLPRFKLVHVLRDGRDIAFSANQVLRVFGLFPWG